jgi:type I restriction enzyme S subunit
METAELKYKKYEAYKDSRVSWIGKMPQSWKEKRLKFVVNILKRIIGYEGSDVLSITQQGIKVKDITSGEGQLAMDYSKYQIVNEGDFAMNHMDLLTGYVDISKYDGVISPDYRVFKIKDKQVDAKYLLILFQKGYNDKIFYAYGQGVSQLGRWRFPADNFNNFRIPLPTIEEQNAIANFLDHKTVKIDQTIAQKEKLIELLKERKQILIQNAVTKGLDLYAKMKDSGVEWIGEIPEHWEVKPFTKYVVEKADYRGATPEKVEQGIFLLTAKNIGLGFLDYACSNEYVTEKGYNKIMQRGLPKIGDLLFTTEAPLGHFALIDREDVCLAQRVIRFRLNQKFLLPEYTLYSVISNYFQNQLMTRATGSTALGIKASKLSQLKIICPPISEQKQIVSYIETQSTKIDKAIVLQQTQIEKLKEYKATLIDSAVTGKIKVN